MLSNWFSSGERKEERRRRKRLTVHVDPDVCLDRGDDVVVDCVARVNEARVPPSQFLQLQFVLDAVLLRHLVRVVDRHGVQPPGDLRGRLAPGRDASHRDGLALRERPDRRPGQRLTLVVYDCQLLRGH